MRELVSEVEQFLYREALLLDEGRFEAWLGLLTEDVRYLVPTRPERLGGAGGVAPGEAGALAYLDEDLTSLRQRVARLGSGMAWAEVPPSRVVRVVGNVLVEAAVGDELDVRSVLLLHRHRGAYEVEQFCGHRHDVLRRVDGELRLARRTTWLAANGLPGKNLAVFL